jgi:mono/diheme cytochrome c family protein
MLVSVVLAALALAGCGATASPGPSGRAVFARACSACHSLTGHEDPRRQGGDLLGFHFGRVALVQFTREMPVRRRLSESGVQAVVSYVMAVQRRGRG